MSDGVHRRSFGLTSGSDGHSHRSLDLRRSDASGSLRTVLRAHVIGAPALGLAVDLLRGHPLSRRPCHALERRTVSLAAPMSAECLPCLSDGAVWQMFPAVSFLCLEVLGE